MPVAPPQLRPRRAPELVARQEDTKREAERLYDRRRAERLPWRGWYATPRWRAIRLDVLARSPLCVKCEEIGRVEPASVVDHVVPHRGDVVVFWAGPFQALCARCHNRLKQREERARG